MEWWQQKKDADLFSIFISLPALEFGRLVRQHPEDAEKAKDVFFKTSEPPTFRYRRAEEVDITAHSETLHKAHEQIIATHAPQEIKDLYVAKIGERRARINLIAAIQQGNDEVVTTLSENLFGAMTIGAAEHQEEFSEMLTHPDRFYDHNRPVTPVHLKRMLQQVLAHYGIKNWRIVLDNVPSMKIRHDARLGISTAYLPNGRNLTKARAARLLTHEVEVHALRNFNGLNQPYAIFGTGLERYLQTEEGLAVLFQIQHAKEPFEHLPGFWDAWTVALAKETNFVHAFETITEAKLKLAETIGEEKPEQEAWDEAWRLVTRVYRGITHTETPNVGYIRDHIYRTGTLAIERALKEQKEDNMPLLFTGKVALGHLPLIRSLDLVPGKTPELIAKQVVNDIMKQG